MTPIRQNRHNWFTKQINRAVNTVSDTCLLPCWYTHGTSIWYEVNNLGWYTLAGTIYVVRFPLLIASRQVSITDNKPSDFYCWQQTVRLPLLTMIYQICQYWLQTSVQKILLFGRNLKRFYQSCNERQFFWFHFSREPVVYSKASIYLQRVAIRARCTTSCWILLDFYYWQPDVRISIANNQPSDFHCW